MKGTRIVLCALALSMILVLTPTATADPWTAGQTWAYKWEKDYSQSGSIGLNNATISGSYAGKAVYAYYVEYAGMENEYYRFNFTGVHYSWANLDVSFTATSENETGQGSLKLQQKTIWVEFYGYFYMKEKNISTFSEEHSVYAVYKLDYTVYSKADVEYNAEMHARSGDNNRFDATANAKGRFNISVVEEFEDGLPFIPIDAGSYTYWGSTECNYTAHANANINGKWNLSALVNGTTFSLGGVTDINVNKDYSGTTSIWYTFSVSGNRVTRAGLIANIGTKVLDRVGCHGWNGAVTPTLTRGDPEMEGYAGDMGSSTSATYDPSSNYYKSESNSDYGNAQQTDKNTVSQIIANPAATYGSYSAPSTTETQTGAMLLMLLIAGVVIILVVVVVVVAIVLRRKKTPPAAQSVPPAQGYQEQAPQYPPQYPQNPAPQPQQPVQPYPQQPPQNQPPQPPTY